MLLEEEQNVEELVDFIPELIFEVFSNVIGKWEESSIRVSIAQ